MSDPTTEPAASRPDGPLAVTTAPARRKVYVEGAGGVRVPFVEVALSASPGLQGTRCQPPRAAVRHLGARVGADRRPPAAARPVDHRPRRRRRAYEGGRSAAATTAGPPSAGEAGLRRRYPSPPTAAAVDRGAGDPAPLRPPGRGHPGDGLRGRPGGDARRVVREEIAAGRAILPANMNHPESEPMVIGAGSWSRSTPTSATRR